MVNPISFGPSGINSQADFSPLAQLGPIYQKAQQDQANKAAIAAFQQTGDTRALLGSGDMSLIKLGTELEQQKRAQLNSDRSFDFQKQSHADTLAQQNRAYGLQERSATRADEAADPIKQAEKATVVEDAQRVAREKAVIARGLDPKSASNQAWILTGKMPREDAQPLTSTDKKAILEADEAVSTNQAAIDSLVRAKELSKKAYSGLGAGPLGAVTSQFGGEAGVATENLTNEVMTNALGQLKAIFGGAPTEGERKILLDMQGAVTKPDKVRQDIFDRAKAAAEKRLEFNRQRAEAMRGGTYYKPQGGSPAPATSTASSTAAAPVVSPAPQTGARPKPTTKEGYDAMPSGTTFIAPDGSERVKP